MITHYDMTTGEAIGDETRAQPVVSTPRHAEAVSLRLLTVQEASTGQTGAPTVPADIAMLAVESLVSKWS